MEVIPGAERSQIPGVKDNVLVKEKDAEVKEMGAMENYYSEGYKQIQCLLFWQAFVKFHKCFGGGGDPRTNFSHFQPTFQQETEKSGVQTFTNVKKGVVLRALNQYNLSFLTEEKKQHISNNKARMLLELECLV